MATVAELVEAVSAVTMVEKKTVNAYARALIDAGSLPISKGRAIAHVSPAHCANLLLAVAVQPVIKVSADVVRLYAGLIAETGDGLLTAAECLSDLFGAASAGGLDGGSWKDVRLTVYESRLGLDISLPHGRGVLEFRISNVLDFLPVERVRVDPNPFFSRSASIPFDAFVFICEVMQARRREPNEQGRACAERIEGLRAK
ncbi:MAG: hypothetical protein ACK4HD_09205 [Pannonibacter phragmitetus]